MFHLINFKIILQTIFKNFFLENRIKLQEFPGMSFDQRKIIKKTTNDDSVTKVECDQPS
jgi:hypothetical protein